MLARFRTADHQLAAEKFLVVQFLHRALGFLDRLHGDEGETFRALIVAIAYNLGVLHVADAVKELEKIALGRVERQIADVKTRRRDFDWLRFTLRSRLALVLRLLLLTVARLRRWFAGGPAVPKKCDDALPECFLFGSWRALLLETPAAAPSSRPTAPMALASPRLIRVHVDP